MMGNRLVAATCASLLFAAPALAQPKTPTPQQKQQAGELVKQAIAKSQANDHQGAIDLYLQAYGIVPLPLLLSNVGSEYKALAKPVEALRYFCKYLEADPTGTNASYATSEAKVLQIQLGNKTVDDKAVCAPPPVVAPPPPPPPDKTHEVHEAAGTTGSPGMSHLKLAGLVTGGVGVVSLIVGTYFGVEAQSISNEISNHNPKDPWPDNINDREKTGQSDENKQILFLVVGGIAVGAGAVLYVMGRSSGEVAVTPVATPNGGGVVFGGRF